MGFTDGQWRSLAIVPHFTSALSMIGDTWILFDILWRRRRNKSSHQMQPNNNNNTTCTLRFKSLINYITNSISSYHRIIMMMSIWDFIVISLGKFPASWAMPVDTPNVWYAAGTRQTCTMQGFFIQFSLIVPIYNSMTALYYLLVVHFGLSNRVIATKVERWIHICPFVVAFSFAFVGLVPSMSLYSTSTMWCWMNAEPKGCTQSYQGGETTCTRGDNAYIYRLAFYYAPIWCCIIFATISMIIIYNAVRKQEANSKRFHANRFNISSTEENEGRRIKRRVSKRSQVATQAYWYVGGFIGVWTVPTINRVLGFFGIVLYPLTLLHAIFSPLQGVSSRICDC